MRTTFKPGHALTLVALLGLGISTVAWTGSGTHQTNKYYQDTIPGVRQKQSREDRKYRKDLDKELSQLDEALKNVESFPDIDVKKLQQEIQSSLENMRVHMDRQKIDMEKMQQELQESLRALNSEKMQQEMQQAMKQLEKVDVQKMKADLERSLSQLNSDEFRRELEILNKTDGEKLRKELRESLRSVDAEKMQRELHESLRELDKVDMSKARADMENILGKLKSEDVRKQVEESMSKINMDEMRRNMERAKADLERNKEHLNIDMDKVREDIRRAKEELKAYQQLIEEMENDGLIDTREDYKIQFKDKELFINGKKQSEEVTDKYRKFFKEDTVIEKQDGNMNINRDRYNNNSSPRKRSVSI